MSLMAERIFRTLQEVKDAFFPNITIEELEGRETEEQIQENLKRVVEIARRNSKPKEIDSKKLPR